MHLDRGATEVDPFHCETYSPFRFTLAKRFVFLKGVQKLRAGSRLRFEKARPVLSELWYQSKPVRFSSNGV